MTYGFAMILGLLVVISICLIIYWLYELFKESKLAFVIALYVLISITLLNAKI